MEDLQGDGWMTPRGWLLKYENRDDIDGKLTADLSCRIAAHRDKEKKRREGESPCPGVFQ